MSTAVFEVACSIPLRINELDRILKLAVDMEARDEETYNSLCRACCILLASHLEGFLKDFSKSLTTDLNFNLKSFAKMPEAMKRSFCQRIAFYEGVPDSEINRRIGQLIDFFSSNSVAIDFQSFSYKETPNKNPGPVVLESVLAKMGVPSVLDSMRGGRVENIFKNDEGLTYLIRRDMRRFRANLYKFPYAELPKEYGFNYENGRGGKAGKERSLFHTFIEEVMRRRHAIAHGDTMVNETTAVELTHDVSKMEVLMHSILYSASTYLVKK